MTVRPAKTQISLGIHPVWSVSADCMKKAWVLSYQLNTQLRLRSAWASHSEDSDQTGQMPRLIWVCWAQTHFVGFVMLWLMWAMSWENLSSEVCEQVAGPHWTVAMTFAHDNFQHRIMYKTGGTQYFNMKESTSILKNTFGVARNTPTFVIFIVMCKGHSDSSMCGHYKTQTSLLRNRS